MTSNLPVPDEFQRLIQFYNMFIGNGGAGGRSLPPPGGPPGGMGANITKLSNSINALVKKGPGLAFSWGGSIPRPGVLKEFGSGRGPAGLPPFNVIGPPNYPPRRQGRHDEFFRFDLERRLLTAFVRGVQELDDLQKRALENGMLLDRSFNNLIPILSDMPGGLRNNLVEAFNFVKAGMKKPTESMFKLASHLRTVGGDLGKMHKVLAEFNAIGGVNVDKLSTTLLNTTRTYNVATDTLIGALDGLSEQIIEYGILGVGDNITEAVTMLNQFGPQFSRHINTVVQELTKVGVEGTANAAFMGLSAERVAILNAKTSMDVMTAVKSAVMKMSTLTNRFMGSGSGDSRSIGLGVALNLFGENMVKSSMVLAKKMDQLDMRTVEQLKVFTEFGDTLSNFGSQLLNPMINAFRMVIPGLTAIMNWEPFRYLGQFAVLFSSFAVGIGVLGGLFAAIRPFIGIRTGVFGSVLSIILVALQALKTSSSDGLEVQKESLDIQKAQLNKADAWSEYSMELADKNVRISEEIKALAQQSAKEEAALKLNETFLRVEKLLEDIANTNKGIRQDSAVRPYRGK